MKKYEIYSFNLEVEFEDQVKTTHVICDTAEEAIARRDEIEKQVHYPNMVRIRVFDDATGEPWIDIPEQEEQKAKQKPEPNKKASIALAMLFGAGVCSIASDIKRKNYKSLALSGVLATYWCMGVATGKALCKGKYELKYKDKTLIKFY